jgi:hypothetical protein
MYSNLLLYSITLFLAAQGAKSALQVDDASCSPLVSEMNEALQEAVNMAEFAYQRTVGLRAYTLNRPDELATMYTFWAYFGSSLNADILGTGTLLIS